MRKVAFITGITGQDGSYLSELLLEKGYEVHGMVRRSSSINTKRIDHIFDQISLHYGDMTDSLCLDKILSEIKPTEIYHLAAQSHVKVSFELPEYTGEVDALGTLKLLESFRKNCPDAKFYNACTSELYGQVVETPQTEKTPFHPRSPYGVAKLYSFWIAKNYRESYGLKIKNGILFNHESERRGETFVTRKVTLGLAKIKKQIERGEKVTPLKLGNLYSKRDWGYAPDFVYGMYLINQSDLNEDFVLSTNETHTIKEFIEIASKFCGLPLSWSGDGLNESASHNGLKIIEVSKKYFRPAEVDLLLGDYSKANRLLGWEPKVKFDELVQKMIVHDLNN